MTHTPGPWIHDKRGYPHPDVKAANGRNIACTWGVNNQPKTKEAAEAQTQIARANARLIAAAPDLLETLKLAREYINEHLKSLIECETNPATGLVAPAAVLLIESDQDLLNQVDAAIAKATGSAS